MSHDPNSGNWDWHRRRRRGPSVVLLRQFVATSTFQFPALSNPGAAADCYLKLENLRATYITQAENLKKLILDCERKTGEYLQAKLQFIAFGASFEQTMKAKEQELYNLNVQKNSVEDTLRLLYNEMVTTSC